MAKLDDFALLCHWQHRRDPTRSDRSSKRAQYSASGYAGAQAVSRGMREHAACPAQHHPEPYNDLSRPHGRACGNLHRAGRRTCNRALQRWSGASRPACRDRRVAGTRREHADIVTHYHLTIARNRSAGLLFVCTTGWLIRRTKNCDFGQVK